MVDIVEQNTYPESIELIDETELVKGGIEGSANKQAIALANRTGYLKGELDTVGNKIDEVGGKKIVTVDVIAAQKDQTYKYDFEGASDPTLLAFALKSIAGTKNIQVERDSFAAGTENTLLMTDRLFINSGLKINPTLALNFASVGDINTTQITAVGRKLVIENTGNNLIPIMTGANTPSTVEITSSPSTQTYFPYYPFDGNVSTFWQSAERPTEDNPAWIALKIPEQNTISRIALTAEAFVTANPPTKFTFQVSSDGNSWTDVQTFEKPSGAFGATRHFVLNSTQDLPTHIRLLITGVEKNAPVTINKIEFLSDNNKLLIEKDNKFYDYYQDSLIDVTSKYPNGVNNTTLNAQGYGVMDIPESVLNTLGNDFTLHVSGNVSTYPVKTFLTPHDQIAINKDLSTLIDYDVMTRIVLTTSLITDTPNGGLLRFAVTRDGQEFFVYKNGVWSSIGNLGADEASATKLIEQGNSYAEIQPLRGPEFTLLFDGHNPDKLGMAYAFTTIDVKGLNPTVTRTRFILDELPAWQMVSNTEVAIRHLNTGVSFQPLLETGNYKFNYQVPFVPE